jgi:hypothetical protein
MAKKTKAELFKNEGQLIRVFGSKTLFAVSPVPEIDRVKFSIVELNTKGKDFIDIYLTTEEVRQFCADIDKGIAKKKIDEDKGNYPTAYQWVRGENGAKRLIIGGGMKGIRIQSTDASDKNNTKKKMALIQFTDLYELSFMFKLAYGLIPVQNGSYYEFLFKAFADNIGKRRGNAVDYDASNDEATDNHNDNVDLNNDDESGKIITTISRGSLQTAQGLNAVPVIVKETGESTNLIFTDEQVSNLKWFSIYEQRVNAGETEMIVKALRKGKYYYFVDVAKK